MTLRVLGYPLRFLRLTDERGHRLFYRDAPAIFVITCLISLPYVLLQGSNYFGDGGFLDRAGAFSSTLTGFYVAGLVAVAAFGREVRDLDKVIEIGPVLLPASDPGELPDRLTRREYVCLMFGYLAFLSLVLTLLAIFGLTITSSTPDLAQFMIGTDRWNISIDRSWIRSLAIALYGFLVSCLAVTTLHGLYYLMDRLYATSPEIVKKPRRSDKDKD